MKIAQDYGYELRIVQNFPHVLSLHIRTIPGCPPNHRVENCTHSTQSTDPPPSPFEISLKMYTENYIILKTFNAPYGEMRWSRRCESANESLCRPEIRHHLPAFCQLSTSYKTKQLHIMFQFFLCVRISFSRVNWISDAE